MVILDVGFHYPGNILNFNVGASVDLDIPRSFWSRLAGKYGNIFYWKEKVKFHVACAVFCICVLRYKVFFRGTCLFQFG